MHTGKGLVPTLSGLTIPYGPWGAVVGVRQNHGTPGRTSGMQLWLQPEMGQEGGGQEGRRLLQEHSRGQRDREKGERAGSRPFRRSNVKNW